MKVNSKLSTSMVMTVILCMAFIFPANVTAQEPSYGEGIIVDGLTTDWDLNNDFFADMYLAGNPDFAILSSLYLRYSCEEERLYLLVLDYSDDLLIPDLDPDEVWLKIYDLSNNTLVNGDCGGPDLEDCGFEWVFDLPDGGSPLLQGFEAYAEVAEGFYFEFEAHMNVSGETSSTGKRSSGNAIPLFIQCEDPIVDAEELPTSIALQQNYPNPFNPLTTIKFSLDQTSFSSLIVYDLVGHEVATLVSGLLPAGEQSVTFDASNISSGVYIYSLQVGNQNLTRKLVLIK
jgi:hypothetical protein